MENLKPNTYIEIFNPTQSNYFPVRILEKTENGYRALILENDKEINIYDYQLRTYGYRNIWINQEIIMKVGFEKDGLKYKLNDLIIFEGLIGDFKNIDHPFYLFEFSSKHIGFAFLKNEELKQFQEDYAKIDFSDAYHPIKDKYFFSSSISDVFSKLIEIDSNKFNYKSFDKIVIDNR